MVKGTEQGSTDTQQDDVMRRFIESCRTLGPLVNRHMLPKLPGQPPEVRLGWAQLGGRVSLGVFPDSRRFAQVALADEHGRVFFTDDPHADVFELKPVFQFVRDDMADAVTPGADVPDAGVRRGGVRAKGSRVKGSRAKGTRAYGHAPHGLFAGPGRTGKASDAHGGIAGAVADATAGAGIRAFGRLWRPRGAGSVYGKAVYGNVLGMDVRERMMWLASWSKRDGRYTLEQLRPELDASLREGLEYRDAIAVAFFAAFLLPRMRGLLVGFGTGNIFRRLRIEAPIGAIRRAARDTMQARSMGMRISGLEEHFSHLMSEAGAFDQQPELEAEHGAEPLHLFTSTYSGSFVFAWHGQMAFKQMLTVLRIEGNLNRFSQVSAWLERNARLLRAGAGGEAGTAVSAMPDGERRTVTEETADELEVARLDAALLDNPALSVLKAYSPHGKGVPFDPVREDGTGAAYALYRQAAAEQSDGSEWAYRQRLASLLRRMRLPYRFDVDFRSNLDGGEVAMAFTSAGLTMMPKTRFDATSRLWRTLDDADRARMSAQYNLRVGLLFAALAFGVDERVRDVHLQIDSIGLEEVVSKADDELSQLYSDVIQALGQASAGQGMARQGGMMGRGSKGDPKDGDLHGDPDAAVPAAPEDPLDADPAGSDDRGQGDQSTADAGAGAPDGDVHADGAPDGGESNQGESDGHASATAANATSSARSTSSSGNSDGMDDVNRTFDDLMSGIGLNESAFSFGGGPADDEPADDDAVYQGAGDRPDDEEVLRGPMNINEDDEVPTGGLRPEANPMEVLRDSPVTRHLVSVRFERERFLRMLSAEGLNDPVAFYHAFDATMDIDGKGGLKAVSGRFDLSDARFAPHGAQEEPELSDVAFDAEEARVFGTHDSMGLSIQRADVLQRAVNDFHRLASADMPSVEAAHESMELVRRIGDPELDELSSQVTSALIDGNDTPDLRFTLSGRIDGMRLKMRDLLFGGNITSAIDAATESLERLDAMFTGLEGVPRYFNSYAERVVYNRLFATPGETTVLIPDNLFYAHMELADVLAQIATADEAIPHLNAMVQYAPAYPVAHMRLAVQLARKDDWAGARAATLNALRVSLDGADAAYAYYRYAYAEWMRDEFALAAAGYVMADHIKPGAIGALEDELAELMARADSQCIDVPHTPEQAADVLREHGVPVWPETDALPIVDEAAHMAVDKGLFVPARTLSLASARLHGSGEDGLDILQAQFLRSLNP